MTEERRLFPLEKILTVSARDYCNSVGTELCDYEMKGVHTELHFSTKGNGELSDPTGKLERAFGKKIPEGTEVVVGYQSLPLSYNYVLIAGTALIPKKKESMGALA